VQIRVSPLVHDPKIGTQGILDMRRFTRKELAQYNGRDGAPAFIAYEGKVYDVSHSFLWQDGRHQVLHMAGVDLTASLDQAPHGADLLERFPVIGMLDGD
jgi:predicted heme/steroid binding protein